MHKAIKMNKWESYDGLNYWTWPTRWEMLLFKFSWGKSISSFTYYRKYQKILPRIPSRFETCFATCPDCQLLELHSQDFFRRPGPGWKELLSLVTSSLGQLTITCPCGTARLGTSLKSHASFTVPGLHHPLPLSVLLLSWVPLRSPPINFLNTHLCFTVWFPGTINYDINQILLKICFVPKYGSHPVKKRLLLEWAGIMF